MRPRGRAALRGEQQARKKASLERSKDRDRSTRGGGGARRRRLFRPTSIRRRRRAGGRARERSPVAAYCSSLRRHGKAPRLPALPSARARLLRRLFRPALPSSAPSSASPHGARRRPALRRRDACAHRAGRRLAARAAGRDTHPVSLHAGGRDCGAAQARCGQALPHGHDRRRAREAGHLQHFGGAGARPAQLRSGLPEHSLRFRPRRRRAVGDHDRVRLCPRAPAGLRERVGSLWHCAHLTCASARSPPPSWADTREILKAFVVTHASKLAAVQGLSGWDAAMEAVVRAPLVRRRVSMLTLSHSPLPGGRLRVAQAGKRVRR